MYALTLTHEERKAIDWIGDRYSNGAELFHALWGCDNIDFADENTPMKDDSPDWDGNYAITFLVPEHVAWGIRDRAEAEDGYWPCFADELASKMQAFCDAVV